MYCSPFLSCPFFHPGAWYTEAIPKALEPTLLDIGMKLHIGSTKIEEEPGALSTVWSRALCLILNYQTSGFLHKREINFYLV